MSQTLTHAATYMPRWQYGLFQKFQRWYRERQMISALQALSDAELKDIGVCRCEIAYLAHERWGAEGEP